MTEPAKMERPEDVKMFVMAGYANFTLKSAKSGKGLTYRVKTVPEPSGDVTHFVSVLTHPGTKRSHSYLGIILQYSRYRHGAKSNVPPDDARALAFDWFWDKVIEQQLMPADIEVWHDGRCSSCGRELADPEGMASGIGPECRK